MHSPSSSSFEIQVKFTNALNIVRSIPVNSHSLQPVAADKLQFYGLYKQATEGDINIPKPSSRKVVEYAKWKAWNRMKGFTPTEAQKLYIESLIQLLTEVQKKHSLNTLYMKLMHSLFSLFIDIQITNIFHSLRKHYIVYNTMKKKVSFNIEYI